jgi:hypothetical protein
MKISGRLSLTFSGILLTTLLWAQTTKPDLSAIENKSEWKVYNRNAVAVTKGNNATYIYMDAARGDGLAVYQNLEFENGIIEFDVKGKDVLQRSFVGLAFHIQDENTFDAIYFRPFNFKKPERAGHSLQYVSHPEFTWQKLRAEFPEQFENSVDHIPNPEDYFHARVEVNWPSVKVFVENASTPSLDVQMKSTLKKGKIGFWVGNESDGSFKNLVVKQ